MLTYRPRPRTTHIVLHDSHTGPEVTTADYLRTNGREMGLLDIGYHFVIERDGYIRQTRNSTEVGSHLPMHNHYTIGICLIGGRDCTPNFTDDQMDSLKFLVRRVRSLYPDPLPLVGHYEISKAGKRAHCCPCLDMNKLRKELDLDVT